VNGSKIRNRSESFRDFYSQATLFWNSMTPVERKHIVAAFRFELGKVEHKPIRTAVVARLNEVDHELATQVAAGVGVPAPGEGRPNHGRTSPALSQVTDDPTGPVATRKVAILAADGVDGQGLQSVVDRLSARGVIPEILAPHDGPLTTSAGDAVDADRAMTTMASVHYDAVLVPCGPDSAEALCEDGYALHFVAEAFKHQKPVAAFGAGTTVLDKAGVGGVRQATDEDDAVTDVGVTTTRKARDEVPDAFVDQLCASLARHRAWGREVDHVPA
jgi:catalase